MKQKNISRRSFLKLFGAGTVATAAVLYGCDTKNSELVDQSGSHTDDVPVGKMTYRTTPTSGDKVSLLGFGMMRFPTRTKQSGNGEEIDQEAVNQLVDYAIEHGVNYFDTSPRYIQGMSEPATGAALVRHPREKFLVATKLSNQASENWSREKSMGMYHQSFKNLQVDVIDYYLLHSIGGGDNGMENLKSRFFDNGMLDFLVEERKKGKIRNLGFSYHGDIAVYDYLLSQHDKYHWDFVQIQMNYVDWENATGRNKNAEYLYSELAKRNIPAVIMEPLLGGRLGKLPQHLFLQLKARRPEDSAASWAFRFAGTPPMVLTSLSGMNVMEHLQDNIRSHSPLIPISDEEDKMLKEIAVEYLKYPLVSCTECQYCMPCPYGINIPGIFSYYNKMVNDGAVPKNLQDKQYRKLRRNFLLGYARKMQPERQADHCISCNICLEKCPQHIRIPREMSRINDYIEDLKQEKEFGE
ncbi:MAG: aldo/keto reductase [Prevotellaceae bacterium]|jgi:predicted aldo/keto reductase-like oxidoreductase|nr:aldo/keto reductase [Prevotellaceae bacterium]